MCRNPFPVVSGLLLLAVLAGHAAAQSCELRQNDPNPFCDSTATTVIVFTLQSSAMIRLEVLSPDSSAVLRTLAFVLLPAGTHTALWDGRDDQGALLPEDDYPYKLTAGVCEQYQVASIRCHTPVTVLTWGRLKALMRRVF